MSDYGQMISRSEMLQIRKAVSESYDSIEILGKPNKLGLIKLEGEDLIFCTDRGISKTGDFAINNCYEFPEPRGSNGISVIFKYMEKHVKRQILILICLAAPIAACLEKNIVFGLVGESSTGKTTLAKLGVSLFFKTDYNRLSKSFFATENALLKGQDGTEGLPTLIDDTSLLDNSLKRNYDSLIYQFQGGKSKQRMSGLKLAEQCNWHTSTIFTSERSLIENTSVELSGSNVRFLEVPVEGAELFDSAEECRMIQHYYSENYGKAGQQYLMCLTKEFNRTSLLEKYKKTLECVECELLANDDYINGMTHRLGETIAILWLAADLSKSFLKLEFDKHAIAEMILKLAKEQIERKKPL